MLRWEQAVLEQRLLIRRLLIQRLLLVRKFRKLVDENVALQRFMFQSAEFSHCCSCGVLRQRLQSFNSVVRRRSSVCC